MALIKCNECGEQVSTSAKVCPHCGAKVKKPTSWIARVVFVVIVVFLFKGIFSLNENRIASNAPEMQSEPIKIQPAEVKDAPIKEQAPQEVVHVDALALSLLFFQNKIAGNKMIDGKVVELTGIVKRIDEVKNTGAPIIEFMSVDEFNTIPVILFPSEREHASTLTIGATATVRCEAFAAGTRAQPGGAACKFVEPSATNQQEPNPPPSADPVSVDVPANNATDKAGS